MNRTVLAVTACTLIAVLSGCSGPATATSGTSGESAAANSVVAKIGETEITRKEIEEKASSALAGLRQQEYEIMQSALDQAITERLLDAAAAKEGLSRDAFVEREVEKAIAAPTPEEIESFFEQNRGRLGGRTIEQVRDQIARYLLGQRQQERFDAVVRDLRKQNDVVVLLDPPRTEVSADDDPAMGGENAPVEIISFSDYQCPYCSRAEEVVKRVMSEYGDDVRVVFRDFPLDFHEDAVKAAEAAGCAAEQGKFSAMHDALFANQRALGQDSLIKYAEEIGLEMDPFRECLTSGRREAEVMADLAAGKAVGVTGTPAFFVNGRLLSGAQPYEAFAAVIDDELARARN